MPARRTMLGALELAFFISATASIAHPTQYSRTKFPAGLNSVTMAMGDVDEDGRADIIVGGTTSPYAN